MKKLFLLFYIALFAQFISAATYYVGPGGNDSNDGLSTSTPFLTIDKAVATVASNGGPEGNNVILLGGTWPSGTNVGSSSAANGWTSNLEIQGENSDVMLNSLTINCSHLTFRGFKISYVMHGYGGDYITLEDIVGVGNSYWAIRASNITWRRCKATDYFTNTQDVINIAALGGDAAKVPTNILMEDCCFSGSSTPDGNHIDVMQTLGVVNLTVRNCKIYHTPVGLFMPTYIGIPIKDILFEGCYFGEGRLYGSADAENVIFRNNVMNCNFNYARPQGVDEWTGNIMNSYATTTTVEIPDVFENNIVKSTAQTLPPSNIIDPNLTFTEPPCVADNPVDVTGVDLVQSSITLSVNQTGQLTANVIPSNASHKGVTWSSSNSSVASVSAYGLVTALSNGTATITVTTDEGGFTDQCTVNSIFDTQAPSIPTGLTAGTVTVSSAALSWNASTDNMGVTGYKVYTNGVNPVTVAGTSTTISGLADNTQYSFTVTAIDAGGNESAPSQAINVTTVELVGVTSSTTWQSYTESTQTGAFTVMFDAIPNGSNLDALTGIQNGTASAYGDLACIVRFNTSGQIDARNGGAYAATNTVNYTSGVSYHFRVEIDVTLHTYSVYATPSGGSEQTVASGFAFRTEQASVSQLTGWSIYAASGSHNVDNMTFSASGGGDTQAPSVPTGLTVGTITETSVALSWTASTDNVGVTGYKVYTNGANSVSVAGTSTTINGLSSDTQYSFTVSAYDATANESAQSSAVNATTLSGGSVTSYYVDPATGSMSNPGTSSQPWSTLEDVFTAGKTFSAGDIIYLMDGNHGNPVISISNTANVTITKYPAHTPVINTVDFNNANFWTLKDVTVSANGVAFPNQNVPLEHPVWPLSENALINISSSNNIIIDGCDINSIEDNSVWTTVDDWNYKAWNGIMVGGGTNIVLKNNYIKNTNFSIQAGGSTGILIEYNVIENFCGDAIRPDCNYALIQYNIIKNVYDTNGNHDDMIQVYTGSDVTGIEIRGNKMYNYTDANQPFKGACQGLGLFDGMYIDFIIENNLIVVDHWHGITLLGATNCKIVNNTVIDPDNESYGPPWVQIAAQKATLGGQASTGNIVSNNLCTDMANDAGIGTVENNIEISWADYATYFTDYVNFDYTTRSGSPAIDAGTSNNAPTVDIEGVSRPQGSGYDVGAYEYSGAIINVTGISVLPTTLTLDEGQTSDLTETVSPSNATDKSVTWSSNNTSIATVDANGLVTAVSAGNATITVTTVDGGYTANCSVTVNDSGSQNINLALGKPVIVDSEYNSTYVGSNAVDGNNTDPASRWVSGIGYPHYIEIDLGQSCDVEQVNFWTADINGNYGWPAADYQIQYWNGSIWIDIINGTNNTSGTVSHSFATINTSKIKLYVTRGLNNLGGNDNILRIIEIQVWGTVNTSTVPVTGVSVSPTTLTLDEGQTSGLTETVSPSDATDKSVTWSSNNTSVATVDANGLVTAVSAGNAIITVTTVDGGYTATCGVTVNVPGALPSPWANGDVGAVAATGDATYTDGIFTVQGSGWNIYGTADEFHYVYQQISGDATITARVATLTNTAVWTKGGIMMRETLNANSMNGHTFMAPIASNGSKFSYRSATGGSTSEFDGPDVTASYWLRMERTGNTFTSYVSADGTTWTTIGSTTINMSSTYYVGLVVSSLIDGTLATGTFDNVSVTTTSTVPVTGVSVSPTTLTLDEDQTSNLTETVSPSNATDKSVTWSSNNTSVATVDANGLVTAVSAGNATITVTTVDGGHTATCGVTVNEVSGITNLALDKPVFSSSVEGGYVASNAVDGNSVTRWGSQFSAPQWIYVDLGQTYSISRVVLSWEVAYGSGYEIQVSDNTTNWTTIYNTSTGNGGTDDITGLSGSGRYVRMYGITRATSWGFSLWEFEVYGSASLTIPVTGVSVSPASLTLDEGQTSGLTETVSPSNATDQSVTWSSNNTSVATVDASGLVTAVSAGNATITVTTVDGGYTVTCGVTVNVPVVPVTGVSVSPATLTLDEGQTSDLTKTVSPSNATDKSVTWSSNNTSVATVDANGLVTAIASGNATITVTTVDGGYTATCGVTVNVPVVPVTGVSVSPATLTLDEGQTSDLAETVSPSNATDKSVTWSSNNTSVATVDANGLVTAIASGNATITVTTVDGGYTATCDVTVTVPGALPSPWASSDIGAVAATGDATYSSGTFTITGSGADIWNKNDEFRFVYQQVSGDATITARVASLTNPSEWSKAGVMIRESLNSNSSNALCYICPDHGVIFQKRSYTNASTSNVDDSNSTPIAPYWVRLARVGDVITAYYSVDGTTWTNYGSTTISMASTYYVGLPVTSHIDGTLATATFDNVSVQTTSNANIALTAENNNLGLNVYPNPVDVDNYVNVDLSGYDFKTDVVLRIMDVTGKLAYSEQFSLNSEYKIAQLNVSDMNKGIYFIMVTNGTLTEQTKLIVK